MLAVIAEARDKLARGVTVRGGQRFPSTLVRYLAALSHAFAVAVKQRGVGSKTARCTTSMLNRTTIQIHRRGDS
jgi:hypothetical protein